MSSAALQAAPQPPTTVGSHSSLAATTSARPYTAGSSQSRDRDAYYAQASASVSPSSTRRHSRKPSGHGQSANHNNNNISNSNNNIDNNNNTASSQQHYTPSGSANHAAPAGSARVSSSMNPTSPDAAHSAVMAPGDPRAGVPPVVSARTSSNRTNTTSTTDRSRRAATHDASGSPRQAPAGEGQERADRRRSNGHPQVNGDDPPVLAAATSSRARRRGQPPPQEPVPHRPSASKESRASQSASAAQRQATAVQSPTAPSREASVVLNRVIVSQPEVDIARERERMAEAVPSSPHAPSQPSPGGAGPDPSEAVEENGRGPRSRHDHSANAGKREKSSKFGDYYLGNTLGEGEFGKVKMGWKQEGGVQV